MFSMHPSTEFPSENYVISYLSRFCETRSTAVCSRQTDFEVGITCFCRILSTVFGREFNSFYQQFEKILHKLSYFESEINSVACGDFSINLLKMIRRGLHLKTFSLVPVLHLQFL